VRDGQGGNADAALAPKLDHNQLFSAPNRPSRLGKRGDMTSIKSPTRLTRFVIAATWAFFGMKFAFVLVMAVNLIALLGHVPSTFPYPAFGQIVQLSAWGNLSFQFVAGVAALIWIYRVSRNAQRLAGNTLPISPGWAVGWYFVPIGALWKPFEAIEQTWKASSAPMAWRSVPTPQLIRWWWGFWLAGGIAGGVFGFLKQVGVEDKTFASLALILISAIVMGQCVLFNRLVRRLGDLQTSAVDVRVFD
jgi:hypothetical protein